MISELFLHLICSRIKYGGFVLTYPSGKKCTYGFLGPSKLYVRIKTPQALQAVLTNPSLGLGDGFTSGEIVIAPELLPEFFDMVLENIEAINGLRQRMRWLGNWTPSNDHRSQSDNIKTHYDIDNRYYQLFLGETMQYSCGFFVDSGMTLDEAQRYKMATVLAKAEIKPGDRVLDIGCGWGRLAMEAARAGAAVIGITLSADQRAYANEQAEAAEIKGLEAGNLQVLKLNYHDPGLEQLGPFDAIVSVGMFEHVGEDDQRLFFEVAQRLLKPGGRLVLHTITKPAPAPTDQFIARRIFPGGSVPVRSNIMAQAETAGIWPVHMEDFYEHYVTTLKSWFTAHLGRREEIEEIAGTITSHTGLSAEAFWRQRLMYLMASAKAFEHGGLGLTQFVFTNGKPPLGEQSAHFSIVLAERMASVDYAI